MPCPSGQSGMRPRYLFLWHCIPDFLLGRDAAPRCALGVIRLIVQASEAQAKAGRELDAKLGPPLNALGTRKLRALEGALYHQAKAALAASASGSESGNSLLIFGELCCILKHAAPSPLLHAIATNAFNLLSQLRDCGDACWYGRKFNFFF